MPTLKRVVLAVAMAVAIFGLAVPAGAVVIHNGIVAVRNQTPYPIHITIPHHFVQNFAHALVAGGQVTEQASIAPGATWYSDTCCFVAGFSYRLHYVSEHNRDEHLWRDFTPRHCNRNGIPYGFADITIGVGHSYEAAKCYEGPI